MKILKFNSTKIVNFNIKPYLIDWGGKCPSKPQQIVRDFLYPYWKNHIVTLENPVPGSRMRCDFINYSIKCVVEASPEGSHDYNKFFHKNRIGFLNALKRDIKKEEWAIAAGFKFIELAQEDIDNLSYDLLVERFGVYL